MIEYWLNQPEWLGNSMLSWMIASGGALLGYIVAHGAAAILGARLGSLAKRTGRPGIIVAARVVKATRGWLLLLIAIAVALEFLHLGRTATDIQGAQPALQLVTWSLVGIQIAFWVSTLLVSSLRQIADHDITRPANPVMLGVLAWAAQFIVWVTLVLALLAGGGVNITAFVASLGVGGVAVALALQSVLSDLFASISIGLDKPFEVGEFIAFGDVLGTVTKVGIKSTRIQSLSGEELSVSNADLLKNLVHNYSRMERRRVVFGFRIPYGTPREKIQTLVERVKQIIGDEEQTSFDRGHFKGFGEYGFDFEFVYYILSPDYTLYMNVQQTINLNIMAVFEELDIRFAIPARMLHASAPGGAPVIQTVSGG